MSENLERGDDGRFVSPSSGHGWTPPADVGEIAFGQESVERSMGYTPMQTAADLHEADLAVEEHALEALFPQDAEPVINAEQESTEFKLPDDALRYYKTDGSGDPLEPNVSVTLEKAADDLAGYEANVNSYVEGDDLANIVEIVDQARADALRQNPRDAEEYGLDPKEVEANVKAKEQPTDQLQNAKPDPVQEEPEIPGVDPEIARAVANPKVREFLESNYAQAEAVRQQYQNGLDVANKVALAELETLLPDIAALPVHQREGALAHLAQSDPSRFMQAAAKMQQIGQIQAAQQEQHQYSAARTQAQFNEWARGEDAKMNISDADYKAVRDYLPVIGLDTQSYAHQLQTNPLARSAIGQRTMIDAARYHALMNAPKALPTRQAHGVQRPGSANSRSSKDVSVATLSDRLNRSGDIDDAWNLYIARQR
jgi:hypothetical protein